MQSASDAEGEGAKARRVSIPELPVSGASPAGHGRRTSIPALPSAEEPPAPARPHPRAARQRA